MGALNFSRLLPRVSGLVLVVMGAGCGGPELGDIVELEVSMAVVGTASAPETAAVGEAQGGLGVTRAFLSASAVTLVPCESNVSGLELGARGYDVLQEPPQSERVTTGVSNFCGVRLELDPVTSNAREGIPEGATMYVEAVASDGTAVTLTSERSSSLLLEAESGTSFGEQPLLLGFDVSLWLQGLPLPEEMAEMSGELFDAQLQGAAAIYVDANGNQALDEGEETPVARATAPR
ncbi:MAG TPA: hypothetical protein VHP33_40695 [Polyangiaceae bacterium]|nr:hypothetical protein [Polyangiaceae bacterium]